MKKKIFSWLLFGFFILCWGADHNFEKIMKDYQSNALKLPNIKESSQTEFKYNDFQSIIFSKWRICEGQMFKTEHGFIDLLLTKNECARFSKERIHGYCSNLSLQYLLQDLPVNSRLAREIRGVLDDGGDEKMNSKQVLLLIKDGKKNVSRQVRKQVEVILAMTH